MSTTQLHSEMNTSLWWHLNKEGFLISEKDLDIRSQLLFKFLSDLPEIPGYWRTRGITSNDIVNGNIQKEDFEKLSKNARARKMLYIERKTLIPTLLKDEKKLYELCADIVHGWTSYIKEEDFSWFNDDTANQLANMIKSLPAITRQEEISLEQSDSMDKEVVERIMRRLNNSVEKWHPEYANPYFTSKLKAVRKWEQKADSSSS